MARKNYYVILGVPRQATPEAIRTAYRRAAKRHHPDLVGSVRASNFPDVVEAYEVLSDPQRRRAYNEELAAAKRSGWVAAEPTSAEPLTEAEPLISEGVSISRAFRTSRSAVEEEFLDWTTRHFTGVRTPKSGRVEHMNLEVILSPDEAEMGGILPVRVPVFAPCPQCGGTGQDWFYPCLSCRAHGVVQREQDLRIRVPGKVKDGTIWELPLAGSGVHLRLHIRVDSAAGW